MIFLDAFYRYYTHFEPEHAWVATAREEVVGFLTGCVNTKRQEQIYNQEILPFVLKGALRGRYRLGRKTARYAWRLALSWARKEFPPVDLAIYPAHLHINLDAAWRGYGLGRRLLETFLLQLREAGAVGVHLHTTSMNEAACHLYKSLRFCLLGERPTRAWEGLVAAPVFARCYGLALNAMGN